MAKYLLVKHYRGAPAAVNDVPMDQWTPAEIEAHIHYMNEFAARLEGSGEFVDGQALAPEGAWVRYDGEGKPPVTDGPFAETKDLIAGWMIIDVDSYQRAVELAGELSAAPGAGRKPIHEWLEVRPFLSAPPTVTVARQLAAATHEPEVAGLLALFLLHHARPPARTRADGSLVPLSDQDRGLWRRDVITEGVAVLQAALARDQLGEYQAQAAIAALHADAQAADETDWVQIVEWYDELLRLTENPVVRLNRAVAVGEAHGPQTRLAALAELDPMPPRYTASAAYLHERAGDVAAAAQLYVQAAAQAQNLAERNHLTFRAATLRHRLSGDHLDHPSDSRGPEEYGSPPGPGW